MGGLEVSGCLRYILSCRQSQPAHSTYSSRWSSRTTPSTLIPSPPPPHPHPYLRSLWDLSEETFQFIFIEIHSNQKALRNRFLGCFFFFFITSLGTFSCLKQGANLCRVSIHNFTKRSEEGGPFLQAATAQSRHSQGGFAEPGLLASHSAPHSSSYCHF